MCIYVYTHIYQELFTNAIKAIPQTNKNGFEMPMPNSEIIFWKRGLHKYVNIYIYEKLFSKA